MNKLLMHKGGQPVYLDDLDFIQKSIGDAFKAFVDALTDQEDFEEPFVLSGLSKYGTYGVDSGIIAFGGEIFHVPYHPDTADGKYKLSFTEKTGEPRKLKNGTTVDVYQYNVAEWVHDGGYGYEKLYWINEELARRLAQPIWNRLEQGAVVYESPAIYDDRQNVGGIITRTRGGRYLFQGQLNTGDQFIGEEGSWYSVYIDLPMEVDFPPQTIYVPLCYEKSIIPGKVTTTHNRVTVAFWTENAGAHVYNFSVIL